MRRIGTCIVVILIGVVAALSYTSAYGTRGLGFVMMWLLGFGIFVAAVGLMIWASRHEDRSEFASYAVILSALVAVVVGVALFVTTPRIMNGPCTKYVISSCIK